MAGEIAAEWIKIPDGNGGFNKVWVRDSTARRSIAQLQTEIADLSAADVGAIPLAQKGAASGVAELDANGFVPSSQLPSYVDDVMEYASSALFPAVGENGKIYVDLGTNLTYRWSGSAYVEISPSLALGTTSSTAYRGDRGNAAYEHAVTNKGSAFASGLYKITTNSEGHVTGAAAVAKADITSLGIPGDVPTAVSELTNDAGFITASAVPDPSSAAPAMDGTAAAGSSANYARADHVHPSDTAKQDALTTAQMDAVNSGITAAFVTSKFGVVTGIFPSATGYTTTVPYPTGFTQTNSIPIGYAVSYQGTWRTGYGAYSGSGRYFFNMDPTGIQGYISNSYGYDESWKVILMRIDI